MELEGGRPPKPGGAAVALQGLPCSSSKEVHVEVVSTTFGWSSRRGKKEPEAEWVGA